MANLLETLDAQLDQLFRSWNIWSTILAVILLVLLLYPLFTGSEPDTHPLLLTRQANIAPVRQSGGSAVYRSLEIPHSYPLRTGLNVKQPGQSKWAMGKNGDLRDVWRRASGGGVDDEGQPTGAKGKLLTIYGKDIEEHNFDDVSREINAIGTYIQQKQAKAVAIYLPNCIELLATVFAAAYHGFTPVLIPFNQPDDVAMQLLKLSQADFLVSAAGSIPAQRLKQKCPNIVETISVVEKTSRHMDWDQEGASTWHEIVDQASSTVTSDLPTVENAELKDIVTIWQNDTPNSGEIVSFTQGNLVSAIGAQISALPAKHRMSPSDLFLPADALTSIYILVQTLAALYSNASVALNSVAGKEVELPAAVMGVAPTIIAASAETALKLHRDSTTNVKTAAKKLAHRAQSQALAAGYMPTTSLATKFNEPHRASIGTPPGKLRLLYIFERAHAGTPPVSSEELSDLRVFTGARVIYALTASKVAGTVTQTSYYDYRIDAATKGKHSHFGSPVSSLELKLVDSDTHKTTDQKVQGEIVASGPSVQHGSASLGVSGTFRQDGTLAYV
ncbi:hypothetical protein FH972_024478 [Carpinus fangiana]|uniref:AMP-dependent synthetase/ligase domain-containing protein n=1 Tax=Carpinus fangiana TaxID=176857 RepID=A0A5N6KYV9_9ROSI|nr:hypothetical protein FH972_024478 [Carpinus fangiana]